MNRPHPTLFPELFTPVSVLSPWEKIAYAVIVEAADQRRRAPTADELLERVGCSAHSTTVWLVNRLQKRGLIRIERYQRSRRFIVTETGKATAPVSNKTPHWRTCPRPTQMLKPALTQVRERSPDLAVEMIRAAHAEGMAIDDFLCELVWSGWRDRLEAKGKA